MARLVSRKYLLPFILITSLFFLWGFARSILDVLNKHFQDALAISITRSALVQAMTYLGYFLMAIPAGIIITKFGYRRGIVSGLSLFAAGSFLFIPGDLIGSFPLFLLALFLIGCGLAILETSANPYTAELGDPTTSSSRLNLAQSFNGLGCILGPVIVGGFLFSDPNASIALPYSVMGVIVVIAAIIFTRVKLPEISTQTGSESEKADGATKESPGIQLWRLLGMKKFRLGLFALFFYEIAEISINSLFINFTTSDGSLTPAQASILLSFGALGLFMLARIIGSWVMSRIAARKVLLICAILCVISSLIIVVNIATFSRGAIFLCYAFEAIMFPTIFAITISDTGGRVKMASSLLMMTPIGGAVGTLLMGALADRLSLSTSFIVPCAAYIFVLWYAAGEYLKISKK